MRPVGLLLVLLLSGVTLPAVAAQKKKKSKAPTENVTARRRSDLPSSGAGSVQGQCANHPCAKGQECVLVEVHCVAAPCPPMPECVLKK